MSSPMPTLIVKKIPPNISSQLLDEFFANFGARRMRPLNFRLRGTAFVDFDSLHEAKVRHTIEVNSFSVLSLI